MLRRKPRIISRDVERGAVCSRPFSPPPQPCIPSPPKTEADKLYDLIYRNSIIGYRFADNEFGIPWIERSDIEEKGVGVYVIRFRCPPDRVHEVYFGGMARDVCKELNCCLHFIHETRYEFGLSYEDCIWIVQKNELLQSDEAESKEDDIEYRRIDSLEEIEGELVDDSTDEEVNERIEQVMETFV